MEEALKLLMNFVSISAQAGEYLQPIFLAFLTLFARFLIVLPLVWWSFCGLLLVPQFPVSLVVLQSSWKEFSANASNVLGSLLYAFCFHNFVMDNDLMGSLPFYPTGFVFVAILNRVM